jgi:DNA-binding XRE family transcriptional regulator
MRQKASEKMGRNSESAIKIRALRDAIGVGQVAFAKTIGVARSLVAACEGGSRTPSTDFLVRLGNLAAENRHYIEAEWFWREAGVRRMLPAAVHLLKQMESPISHGAITNVPPSKFARQERDAGRWLPFPTHLLTTPLAAAYITVADDSLRPMFKRDDVLVLDESERDPWTMVGGYIAAYRHTSWNKHVRAMREMLTDQEFSQLLSLRQDRLGLYAGWVRSNMREGSAVLTIEAPNSLGGVSSEVIAFDAAPLEGGSIRRRIEMPEFSILGRVVAWVDMRGQTIPIWKEPTKEQPKHKQKKGRK